MVGPWWFMGVVAAVGVQRLVELRQSRRHERRLRARGASEHAAWQMPWMRLLHGSWLAGSAWEVWSRRPPFRPKLAAVAAGGLLAGQVLRRRARQRLGERWTVRVMTLPGTPPVRDGIYGRLRHPNYLGVALEIASLPLIGGAWRSALGFSAANAALLALRIRAEERALQQAESGVTHRSRRITTPKTVNGTPTPGSQ